ncbi:MAG: serine/threonine-protein kinase [Polyangiaceae bacterium]
MLAAPTSTGLAARSLARPPAIGTRPLPSRLGRYLLFDHVGRGGMADIYLARVETELGGTRRVIVKEVLPKHAGSAELSTMLVAEAKLAAGLSHANVVAVEDLGSEGGSLFIAMEYVEGFDLRELCRRCSRAHVPLPVEFSLLMVMEILRGLDYAHRRRVVHRDVSPSNVLISFEGEVKICDFGIARAHTASDIDEETVRGKAGYMSPEHARGEDVDARSDIFAAGIILWELLSGRRFYRAEPGGRLLDTARRADVQPLPSRGLPREKSSITSSLAPSRSTARSAFRQPAPCCATWRRTPPAPAFSPVLSASASGSWSDSAPRSSSCAAPASAPPGASPATLSRASCSPRAAPSRPPSPPSRSARLALSREWQSPAAPRAASVAGSLTSSPSPPPW